MIPFWEEQNDLGEEFQRGGRKRLCRALKIMVSSLNCNLFCREIFEGFEQKNNIILCAKA